MKDETKNIQRSIKSFERMKADNKKILDHLPSDDTNSDLRVAFDNLDSAYYYIIKVFKIRLALAKKVDKRKYNISNYLDMV